MLYFCNVHLLLVLLFPIYQLLGEWVKKELLTKQDTEEDNGIRPRQDICLNYRRQVKSFFQIKNCHSDHATQYYI